MRIVSLRVGLPRRYGADGACHPFDRPWITAIAKDAVDRPLFVSSTGFEGDGVADTKAHGGPEKAVLVGSAAHLPFWRELLGSEEVGPGCFGENLVVEGAVEADVCIGDSFAVGEAVVQVAQPRVPCWKQARRWRRKDLALQIQRTGRTGWYLRVLREGHVACGDELRLIDRPLPSWTVARCNEVLHGRPLDRAAAAELASLPLLARSWRDALTRLAAAGEIDSTPRLVGPSEDECVSTASPRR